MMLKHQLSRFLRRRRPPARPRRSAPAVDPQQALQKAAELQERACGWWHVTWSGSLGRYVAIYLGWRDTGRVLIKQQDPEELWKLMAPYVPIRARVPAVHARSATAAFTGTPRRGN